jgi:hypothetical protein
MSEYDDLVRALLVERYRRWPSPEPSSTTPTEVARALAHEKRPPRQQAQRPAKRARLTDNHVRRSAT